MLTTCARSLCAPNSVSAIKTSLYSIQNVRLSSSATTATGGASKQAVDHLGTYDSSYEEYKIPDGDPDRRQFAYLALGGARFFYASAIRLAVMRFVGSMSASSDVLALASLEVDLGKIPVGQTATVKWRGKPVFVRNRTEEEIELAQKVDVSSLRHQEQDSERVKPGKEQWLVALGVCTHLGCVPISNAGEYHGWFCPCHGSHYDTSGRIRKGPAPLNLEVPPYKFIEGDSKLLIG